MNLENYIESVSRDLLEKGKIDPEYLDLYSNIDNSTLREILASIHGQFVKLFKAMNSRLPTGDYTAHFWAGESRELVSAIEMATALCRTLKNSSYAFEIETYYADLLLSCEQFLRKNGGSNLPPNMARVQLYYTEPIFLPSSVQQLRRGSEIHHYKLSLIGEGSYAQIYKYLDEHYCKHFAVKRAKKGLTEKELERFKREFEVMRALSSPYILEVYSYDDARAQYTMECMDSSLEEFLSKGNNSITTEVRKNIALQILRAFSYLHSKLLIHRDISPKNILLRRYDDVVVVKVSDFGLVKIPSSTLTSQNTELKGYFNDPALATEGFDSYGSAHETYALTKLLYYVMTGRTNTSSISDQELRKFVAKGLNVDNKMRYQSVSDLADAFRSYCRTV